MEPRIEACKTLIEVQLVATVGRDLFTRQEVQDNLLALYSTLTREVDPVAPGVLVPT